jgi:transposase
MSRKDIEKMIDLYVNEGLTLKMIGSSFGVSGETIRKWLKKAKVPLRSVGGRKGTRRVTYQADPSVLEQLYIAKGLDLAQTARALRISKRGIKTLLDQYGIPLHSSGGQLQKSPIDKLGIGRSIIVPRPKTPRNWHHKFYHTARKRGIRISMQIVDESSIRIERIA